MSKLNVGDSAADERRNVVDENVATAPRRHGLRDVGRVESTRSWFVGDVDKDGAGSGQRADWIDADAKQVPENNRVTDRVGKG